MNGLPHASKLRVAFGVLRTMAIASLLALPARAGLDEQSKPGSSTGGDKSAWILKEPEQAIARARKIVGLPATSACAMNATLVTLEEDHTPFLSDQLIGKPLWSVEVSGWRLDLASTPAGLRDMYAPRVLDVLLDPESGTLRKIVSRWPEGEPPIAPEPSGVSATAQMQGVEEYHAFAPEPPPISFAEAIDIIQEHGENPFAAKQITGSWVIWSKLGSKPEPMWIVTLRGIPPIRKQAGLRGVPVNARNHFRAKSVFV